MNSPAASSSPSVMQARALREHFQGVVLPAWRGPGFNHAMRLPYEALGADHQPLPVTRYRTMACARQLFVFAQDGDADHAAVLFESLRERFRDTKHGGWHYSIDAEGTPLDTTRDLYTHAFVVFACAEYARRSGNRDALDLMRETAELILERFAADPASPGLLNAALDAGFSTVVLGPQQNPLMHLTEAWLAAHAASADGAFADALATLGTAVARTFLHEPSGCIAELPLGAPDNRLEPGHQFEWFWLVREAGAPLAASGLAEALERGFAFARRHGVDAVTDGVCAALDETGRVTDATQRIWAQSEYLRALAVREDDDAKKVLPGQIERFKLRFLHAGGWYECKTPDGEVTRADMPSTTPYHLATAYAALPR